MGEGLENIEDIDLGNHVILSKNHVGILLYQIEVLQEKVKELEKQIGNELSEASDV